MVDILYPGSYDPGPSISKPVSRGPILSSDRRVKGGEMIGNIVPINVLKKLQEMAYGVWRRGSYRCSAQPIKNLSQMVEERKESPRR